MFGYRANDNEFVQEREKRLRKKEKKKTGSKDGSVNGEEATAISESATAAITKDTEPVSKERHISKETNVKKSRPPPPHFFSKQLKPKSIPPPLVNRNRKRWLQWGKWVLAVAGIFFLFLLGNTSYIRLKFNGLI